jgi:hypothetical protein
MLMESTHSPLPLIEARLDKIIKGHESTLNELVLARDGIRKHRAENEWKGQKRKRSPRQLAIAEGSSLQEGLERFHRENEVVEGQDALSAVGPRVRAPLQCSNCHVRGHTRVRCPKPLSN